MRILLLWTMLYAQQWDSLHIRALQGNPDAQMQLVEYYQLHHPKPDSARFFLQKAAEKGHPDALYLLGLSYLRGKGAPFKPTLGKKYLDQAAQKGHLLALEVLYETLARPDTPNPFATVYLPYDDKAAFAYALKAAHLGAPKAMLYVGKAYLTGKGTPRNDSLALVWLEKAADAQLPAAQIALGDFWMGKSSHYGIQWTKAYQAYQAAANNPKSSVDEIFHGRVGAYYAQQLPQLLPYLLEKMLYFLASPAYFFQTGL
ncbi:MAG: tetratricopeptide repeat protein [Bacteroidia bacterium]